MNQAQNEDKLTRLKPSDFMRTLRPSLYSDSIPQQSRVLDRVTFESHLETLTSRNEERQFENFCRRLAEREICPNLRPQTGPTGGGDSKVDADTYPVSDSVAERWFEGVGREAAQEAWAFAFSAKKEWRAKVKHDMASIASTERGYKRAYFISNQFIPSKRRAELEEDLSKEHGFSVTILDRNWIAARIYEKDLLYIAMETLNITTFHKETIVLGPNDLKRKNEFEELQSRISDTSYYVNEEDLIEDCLQAALIARGLGKSQYEIDGLFARAEKLAVKYESRQLTKIIYQHAWTAFWWYDDAHFLSTSYSRLELMIFGSSSSWDYEYLVNMLQCLASSISRQMLTVDEAQIELRKNQLRDQLRLIINSGGKSNALWARSQISFIDLVEAAQDLSKLPKVINDLINILNESKNLLEYPLRPLLEIVERLSNILEDSPEFDSLMEKVIEVSGERVNESQQGVLLLNHGYKKLNHEKWNEAIRYFGRACTFLAKEEYMDEFCRAVLGISFAYKSGGLIWAARSAAISALYQLIRNGIIEKKFSKYTLPIIKRIIWFEIELGRIPAIISWCNLKKIIEENSSLVNDDKEEDCQIDIVIGILILKSSLGDLIKVPDSPNVMEDVNLFLASIASSYALGHVDEIAKEIGDSVENISKIILSCYSQPARDQIPIKPDWGISDTSILETYINGCRISWETPLKRDAVIYSETVLAFLESVFSISLEFFYPYRSEVKCNLQIISSKDTLPTCKIIEDDFGSSQLHIYCTSSFLENFPSAPEEHRFLFEIFTNLVCIPMAPKGKNSLELFFKNNPMDRAFFLINSAISLKNILSQDYYVTWGEVSKDTDKQVVYPCRREKEWWTEVEPLQKFKIKDLKPSSFNTVKHNELRVLDLINVPLWDKALWNGLAFSTLPGSPPVLGIIFKNIDPARKIFLGLKERVGTVDENNLIRVIFSTGVNKEQPFNYRTMICPNYEQESSLHDQSTSFLHIGRIHTMTPSSNVNLIAFSSSFDVYKSFLLVPAVMVMDSQSQIPKFFPEFGIVKKNITILEAWNIKENSEEMAMINEDDNPIIPPGVDNPPYIDAVILKRRLKKI